MSAILDILDPCYDDGYSVDKRGDPYSVDKNEGCQPYYCYYPHGATSIFASILAILSFPLAIASNIGCYFVQVDTLVLGDLPQPENMTTGIDMGFFSYEDPTQESGFQCRFYSVNQLEQLWSFDIFFLVAQIASGVALVGMFISMIALVSTACLIFTPCMLGLINTTIFISGIVQGVSFLLFVSNAVCEDCHMSWGGGLGVACAAVTIINSVLVFYMPRIPSEDDDYTDESTFSPPIGGPQVLHFDDQVKDFAINPDDHDNIIVPNKISIQNREMVLVLPDGRKQTVEPFVLGNGGCCGGGFRPEPSAYIIPSRHWPTCN